MEQHDQPTIGGLIVAPNGAQMWVAHDKPIHVSVFADEPFARIYINGVLLDPYPMLDYSGTVGDLAVFDRPLSSSEVKEQIEAARQETGE